jgi:hypothetical protein
VHTILEQRPDHQRAIEFLAQESHVPIDVVTPLYRAEWAKLAIGARITAYISILTIRNVRRVLRQMGYGQRVPAAV